MLKMNQSGGRECPLQIDSALKSRRAGDSCGPQGPSPPSPIASATHGMNWSKFTDADGPELNQTGGQLKK